MNLTNYHSHCLFCDGRADMESFIRFALSQGFTSYGVSSHAPLPFPTAWTMEWDQMDNYFAEFERVKKKYANDIEFYIGLEIDYLNEDSNPASSYFQKLPLDYRIGSVHLLYNDDNKVVDIDVAPSAFRNIVDLQFDGNLERVVGDYYNRQLRMIELGGFDILGHTDKIHHNAVCYLPGLLDELWYKELIEHYFSTVAQHNCIVEINTKAFDAYKTFFPNEKYFSLLRDLGIRVMVNSDSHYPERINNGRIEALDALRKAGYATVVERHSNQWVDMKIETL